jgi:hypothetical protein
MGNYELVRNEKIRCLEHPYIPQQSTTAVVYKP